MATPASRHDQACRYCGRPLDPADDEHLRHWPFCCRRCRLAELGHWFGEAYVISRPADQVADDAALTGEVPPEARPRDAAADTGRNSA